MDPNVPAPKTEAELLDEHLGELEAKQAEELKQKASNPPKSDAIQSDDRASEAVKSSESAPKTDSQKTDTPSEAEKKAAEELEAAQAEAEAEGKEIKLDEKGQPARAADGKFIKQDKPQPVSLTADERTKFDKYLAQKQGSKYAKDFARRLVTWTELNEGKAAFSAEKAKLEGDIKAQRDRLYGEAEAFRLQQAASTPPPEKYEAYAAEEERKAGDLDKQAKAAEADGDFTKADKLREAAAEARAWAKNAKAKAEELRKNPPPSQKQQQEKLAVYLKEWTSKAAIDFPEFAKKDSAVQKEAAAYYRQMSAQVPMLQTLPGFIYFCAERAAYKTAADRVPGLERELGELKTKLKELEALTNPSPSGGVPKQPAAAGNKKFEDMTPDEQFAWLRENA